MSMGPILSLRRLPLLDFPRVIALRNELCSWVRDSLLSFKPLPIWLGGDTVMAPRDSNMRSASGLH